MTTWNDLLKPGNANDFFTGNFPPFEPEATTYSRANALWLAELCRLVYRHDVGEPDPLVPTRRDLLGKGNFEQVDFFNAAGTQAFLVRSKGEQPFAALVFRGTEVDIRDYTADALFKEVPIDGTGAMVHEGFRNAFVVVWEQILRALKSIQMPLFYTGHSLGAALATLAAQRLAPRALYTFGSPLVGDAKFAAELARIPIFRVVDGHDVVTTVPPTRLGYVDVGELHHLDPPKEGFIFDSLEKFRELVDKAAEPPVFLADHAPINYVRRI